MSSETNRGALLLKLKTAKRGTKIRMAEALGIGQDIVSHWISAERRPDTKNRARLEDDYGIPWRTWDDEVAPDDIAKVERQLADDLAAREEAPAEPTPAFQHPPSATGTEGSH